MTLYLDTSLLVAALTAEPNTKRVQEWLGHQNNESLAISEWVTAEFSSALSIKVRGGQIEVSDRAAALALFSRVRADSLVVLPVTGAQFRAAARLTDQHTIGLRAGDALHLSICADHGATFCTLDRRLGEAGPLVGVATMLV